jgi:hypothetical protein
MHQRKPSFTAHSMRFRVDNPTVVSETIDGETIVIDLGTGTYYSLRDSASVIWDELARGATVDEVADVLETVYEGTRGEFLDATETFVEALQQERLLVPAGALDGETSSAVRPVTPRTAFTPPELQKYSDMQDIILLDPVHDVSAQGWPHVQGA